MVIISNLPHACPEQIWLCDAEQGQRRDDSQQFHHEQAQEHLGQLPPPVEIWKTPHSVGLSIDLLVWWSLGLRGRERVVGVVCESMEAVSLNRSRYRGAFSTSSSSARSFSH